MKKNKKNEIILYLVWIFKRKEIKAYRIILLNYPWQQVLDFQGDMGFCML